MTGPAASRKLRIALCHPDLGIGGAERLVVDAAMELTALGHAVHIFTAHHDPQHCFEETIGGHFPVTVYGDFLPRNIFNRLYAVCAYIRCLYVAICMVLFWPAFDVVFVDQVSVVIPVLKLKNPSKILFYCHFPDLLLARTTTRLRKLYRKPIDWLEEVTTGQADHVLVNSEFTLTTFEETFTLLHQKGIKPSVLYPAVNINQPGSDEVVANNGQLAAKSPFFLSINRFERKKNIGLAISAFALIVERFAQCFGDTDAEDARLVIAGGYDELLAENREHLQQLKMLAFEKGVFDRVDFEPSCSTSKKNALLASCICVIYTPTGEHFGIVPLEAMAAKKPVIACNSGGPKESVIHTVTGFLCEPTDVSFASAMQLLQREPRTTETMGLAARKHVEQNFSRTVFGNRLNSVIQDLVNS
ncbi:unnamed protein product [Calypogeia fissa]